MDYRPDMSARAAATASRGAAQYRRLAHQLRALAPRLRLEAAKDELLVLAADYERLSEYVAGMNKVVDLLLTVDAQAVVAVDADATSSISPRADRKFS